MAMFKEIKYWDGKNWKKLKIKTDSIIITTKEDSRVSIIDEGKYSKINVSDKCNRVMVNGFIK